MAQRLSIERGWFIHTVLRSLKSRDSLKPQYWIVHLQINAWKCYLSSSFFIAFIKKSWYKKLNAEVNIHFLCMICWALCSFSYGTPCPYKIICSLPLLSFFGSKFMVDYSFWEKGWQTQMTKNLGIYISTICLRSCRHPWDLQSIRNILTEKVLCGFHQPSLTQGPKQTIYVLNFQLSNFSSWTLSMVLLYFVFWIPL